VPPETPSAPPTPDTSALLARLGPDVAAWDLEVMSSSAHTPTMQRLRLTAPGLAGFSYQPGQDLMLDVPTKEGRSFRRRYTIRAFDPAVPALDVDFVLHGDGPAATWAASARPGDHIEAIGPRGKVTVDLAADWHLFAGDDSAIPASLAMAETLSSPDRAIVILEVDGPADQQEAQTLDGRAVPIRWLHRAGASPASSANLVSAVAAVELPAGSGHAYLAGELGVVNEMRRTLLERGLTSEQISAKPYWRVGRANAAYGEPERP
jgi:NADPH-dependent ferric siderophore reductase